MAGWYGEKKKSNFLESRTMVSSENESAQVVKLSKIWGTETYDREIS